MTLQNLYKFGPLNKHEPDSLQIRKMLSAAKRSITDAAGDSLSSESRLELAYTAIMQLSMVALWSKGYRCSKSVPGHHQTMIQSLVHTIELDRKKMVLLDSFRTSRNAMEYMGNDIDSTTSDVCLKAARELFDHVSKSVS